MATEKSVAMLDEIGIKAAQLFKCESAEEAEKFVNCSLDTTACRCLPADGTVSCSCMQNNVLLKNLNKNALPVKLHDHWIEPTTDRSIVARLNAEPRLQVSVQGLKLKSVIDQNSCKAELHKLSGCSSCVEGAIATFTCTTDFGTAEAHVICDKAVSFPLKCSQRGQFQSINLFFDFAKVDMTCTIKCPSNSAELIIRGLLHHSVEENPWSVRKAADEKENESFIMPILSALQDFWTTTYTLMIVTLIVAAIIAIVILKILKYFI
uniref:Phlebovirus glycoprotein G2 fusion domain-containing protein n=1 Tax=Panagrolaimus superbus TaxID=310955 RepID=A0A914Z730_9BILA